MMETSIVQVLPILLAVGGPGAATVIVLCAVGTVVALIFALTMVACYRRCPTDRLMVITGRLPGGMRCKILNGGAAFVWPLIQQVDYLDLEPLRLRADVGRTRLADGEDLDVTAIVTCAVGTEPALMQAAAERLLGLDRDTIRRTAEDVVRGKLNFVLAGMAGARFSDDRLGAIDQLRDAVDDNLAELGLAVIAFELA